MPRSLLDDPPPFLTYGEEPTPTPTQPPPEPPPQPPRPAARREPPRRGLAVLLVTAALLGGGVSTGLLAVTGALDGDGSTTTVVSSASGSSGGAASSLDAGALYAKAAPGVVDITARGTTRTSTRNPFSPPESSQSTATGTGFVIDGDGHILTAAHVVDGASSITVAFSDGTTRTARLLGQDDATDVAVLSIDPDGLTLHPLELGSSAGLDVGDAVAAIGDPFGYERSLSTGVVSGLDRTIEAPNGFTVAHAIQTDAALNPGNSGGPVLDADGKVIGIADQIATGGTSSANTGVGFAVPIDLVKSELDQLKSGGEVRHAYLGVATGDASGSGATGARIEDVTSGGPAASAGLQAGDVVTKLGGTDVGGPNDLVAAIAAHKPGDRVTVTVQRGSESREVTVTLGTQPTRAGTSG
jgi:putative serine protease PepD